MRIFHFLTILYLCIFNYQINEVHEKYIKFVINTEFINSESMLTIITFIKDDNDTVGNHVYNITKYVNGKYMRIPNYSNYDYRDYIKDDTLIFFANLKGSIIFDSLSENNYKSGLFYSDKKRMKAVFHNDTAEVFIHWKYNDLKEIILKHGDY